VAEAEAGFGDTDRHHMAEALRLAAAHAFTTKPNPMVGCVIAHGAEVVGRGAHRRAGEPHAEVFALREAGARARGATAYVTLEPCAHFGRTPPCTDALVAAGIARVVAALRDPFHAVAGRGFTALQAAGVTVEHGLLAAEAEWLNRGFLMRAREGRPWVRVKLAMSLDGRTALASGESKWITGEAARADVQAWRARASAVLTGLGTVLADDPRLTARVAEGVELLPPLRVVLDHRGALPRGCRLLDGEAPTLVAYADDIVPDYGPAVEGFAVPRSGRHLDLRAVLAQLASRQVNEVQVEAGAGLAGAFLRAGLVDELLVYVAPVLLGERGRPLFGGLGIERMADRIGFERVEFHAFDDGDLRLTLRPRR
jgi:diaminohydroxyphosphoribosylaminopyrimidine deaminase/5-amino-6-(5-phosphoribosylamino)uracil reductase